MALDFPSSPTNGDIYGAYTYDGTKGAWSVTPQTQASVTTSDTAPVNPKSGDQWFYTVDGTMFVYYSDGTSSQWVEQPKSIAGGYSYYRSPNFLINGAFDIWQRGTSGTVAANGVSYPSADRFRVISSGASSPTLTFARSTDIPAIGSVQYSATLAWSASAANGDILVNQFIENGKYLFAGKTITVSFYAKAATAIQSKFDFDQDYGETFFNLTTSWARYSYTITLPSTYATSRPSGSNASDHTELRLIRFTNVASSSNTIYVTGVQVEEGSTATSFRRNAPSLQAELAACQRYYYRINANATNNAVVFSVVSAAGAVARGTVPLPVTMRVPPTTLDWSGTLSHYAVAYTGQTAIAITAAPTIATSFNTETVPMIEVTASTVAGQMYFFRANSTASAYLGLGAEL